MKKFLKSAVFISLIIGGISAAFFSWLYYVQPGFLERIELAVKDYRYRVRNFFHGPPPTDDSIIYCNIDDAALRTIAQWPIPRDYYTKMIQNLHKVKAGTIGFDILFFEKGGIHDESSKEAVNKVKALLEELEEGAIAEMTIRAEAAEKVMEICKEIALELRKSGKIKRTQAVLANVQQLSDALEEGVTEEISLYFPAWFIGFFSKKAEEGKITEKEATLKEVKLEKGTLEKIDQISKEIMARLKNPDEELSDAAKEHAQVLFPMVFSELYLNEKTMEEADKKLRADADRIHNLIFTQQDLTLYNLFSESPFKAMPRIRAAISGDGSDGQGTNSKDSKLQEEDELKIISRVQEVDRAYVLSKLEDDRDRNGLDLIISRKELEQEDLSYWHIYLRGYLSTKLAEQGKELEEPLSDQEKTTWMFFSHPAEFFQEHSKQFEKHNIGETPYRKAHRAVYAEAFGGFLLNKGRDHLYQLLQKYEGEMEDVDLFQATDLYLRHAISAEKSFEVTSIVVDENGQTPRDENHAVQLSKTLRVARDRASDSTKPIVPFALASAEPIYITVERDIDGSIRSYPLIICREDRVFFAMGLVMACRHLGVEPAAIRICPGHFLLLPGARFPDGRVTDIRIPIDEHGQMLVNWAGRFNDNRLFKHYSFSDIVDEKEIEKDKDELAGKLVLIGLTGTGTHDNAPMPFEGFYPLVGAHANIINTILTQNFLKPDIGSSKILNIVIICFLSFLVALAKAALPRFWGTVGFASIFVIYAVTVQLAFEHLGQSLNITYSFFAITVPFTSVLFYRYMTEERQKKRIGNMFSTMVSPEVLNHMQEHPDQFRLTGEKKMATMFFSDVAGFTTISEKLSAEDLAKVLNEYLTPMTNIIMNYGGYVDKYAGDGIMADHGVPTEDSINPDAHAWKACWSALDQQVAIQDIRRSFKEKYNIEIDVRMGINTGMVSAGNMGSEKKFQYTVMGDAVNQAARFEPACKPFHIHIMIGEPTYHIAKDKIEVRFLASMIVKGKTEPVKCYELLAKKGELPEKKQWLVGLFEEGWRLHAERNFEAAIGKFDECLMIDPHDGPAEYYKEICQEYIKTPPPPGWAGEWIQTSK